MLPSQIASCQKEILEIMMMMSDAQPWFTPLKKAIALLLEDRPILSDFRCTVSYRQEANNSRECLVPKIASLWMPTDVQDVIEDISTMYATLSGKEP